MKGVNEMNEPLTIESFFLADYAKVKARNKELENEIREVKSKYDAQLPETGFVDLRTPITLIKVDTECSYYRLFEMSDAPMKDLTLRKIQILYDMDDDALLEKMQKTNTGYCSHAIDIKEKRFPFTVRFQSYKGSHIYAYDPDYNDDALVSFLDSEADTNNWVVSDLKKECIRYALEEVRESLQERIGKLEANKPKADDAE